MSRVLTGIKEIDEATHGGIPSSDVTVLATSDDRTGSMVLGHYLMKGLKNGETTLLISFEQMNSFFENFQNHHFDFKKYYDSNKFLFFNFVPSIRHKIGFMQDYRALFQEIYRLCGQHKPSRIAIHQMDTLINLSNTHLTHLSSDKFSSACRSRSAQNVTVLAQYIKFNDSTHDGLSVALQKSAAGYIDFLKKNDQTHDLELKVKKMPWFDFELSSQTISSERFHELIGKIKNKHSDAAA